MSLQLLPPQGVLSQPLPVNPEQHLTPRELGTIFFITIGALLLLSAPLVAPSFVIGAIGLTLIFIASGSSFYVRRPKEEPIPVPQVPHPSSVSPLKGQSLLESPKLYHNPLMGVHTNANVISFLEIKEMALIRRVNKQTHEATVLAIRIQLLAKINLNFREISNYQRALKLGAPEEILRLLNENTTSKFSQLDLYLRTNDKLLFSLFANAHYSKITSINLTECRAITDNGLRVLPLNLESLQLRGCSQITDEGLRVLPSSLVSLDLGLCRKITDQGLKELSKLTNLESLDLSCCDEITDTGVTLLTSHIKIVSLTLSHCNKITDQGLKELSKLADLESLDLRWCKGISGEGVLQFAHHHKYKLTSLMLQGRDHVTNQVVKALSECTRLAFLELGDSNRITDSGLEALAQLHSLLYLALEECSEITVDGAQKVALLPNLVCLNFFYCHRVTTKAIESLPKHLIIHLYRHLAF